MISMGQKLYEMWAEAMGDEGVIVDGWNDLSAEEQAAWQNVGERVEERP